MRNPFPMKREFPARGAARRWWILLLLGALAVGALIAGLSAETRTLRELHLAMRLREYAKSRACASSCAARPDISARGVSRRYDFGVIGSAIRGAPAL
jgi:hypothetical protein